MQENKHYKAGLYLRLSSDDEKQGESISIGTQRDILVDFCQQEGYQIYDTYIDDGYSGLNFSRPGFKRMIEDVEKGVINMVITKDLSRLGRDYIMTGYYSEIFFPAKGVRYIALADDYDSEKGHNDIAPFKNILNEMYARDISKKVKHAKHIRAKQGLFVGSQPPYGYQINPNKKGHLIIDPEPAKIVRLIYSLAQNGMGSNLIAAELKSRQILTPSVYKYQHGDTKFGRFDMVENGSYYDWRPTTVGAILTDPVYTGQLVSLKTESTNCKTKQYSSVPPERRIVTPHAHEAIISEDTFAEIASIRAERGCRALTHRYNLFRGKLFCDCCGHGLIISKKQLKSGTVDMYLCMHHYNNPEECPKTHRIYHDMLYPYVLQQIRAFAKSMKRRKVNSAIKDYAMIQELTPEILDNVIERIEISHVCRKSKPGNVIHIYWKF